MPRLIKNRDRSIFLLYRYIEKMDLSLFFVTAIFLSCSINPAYAQPSTIKKGIWVSCFSEKKVLYSKNEVRQLIKFCRTKDISEIYLQFYRAGRAYYNSSITDRSGYEAALKSAGTDTITLLLKEARRNKIKVFAWINILSISQNIKADIIKKYGESVLTRDQHSRFSMRDEKPDALDKYYLRDTQLFLEPGDGRVVDYVLSIVDEIRRKYPRLDGIHLDYIRYPHTVGFIPSSRFNKFGISYGYGRENVKRFKDSTKLDPFLIKDNEDQCFMWDNWRREQLTLLVQKIRENSPKFLISCAVIPSVERAYLVVFQDWPLWLEKGIIDYVVLMNYTSDNQLTKELVQSALSYRAKGKVYVGVGVFLMKDKPDLFSQQYKIICDLKPDGVVFFSYDDMLKLDELSQ
jgi:uncharacterized lipoprotein YddW (UPF0748 family)